MRAREIILRAAEGQSLGPAGEPRVVQLEVFAEYGPVVTERAIVYTEAAPGSDDLESRVYFAQGIPVWVRAFLIAVLEFGEGS